MSRRLKLLCAAEVGLPRSCECRTVGRAPACVLPRSCTKAATICPADWLIALSCAPGGRQRWVKGEADV